jgi:hypothetical protein
VKVLQRWQWRSAASAMLQRVGQALGARPVVLQQVVGHALRRLGTDARQAAQCLDQ